MKFQRNMPGMFVAFTVGAAACGGATPSDLGQGPIDGGSALGSGSSGGSSTGGSSTGASSSSGGTTSSGASSGGTSGGSSSGAIDQKDAAASDPDGSGSGPSSSSGGTTSGAEPTIPMASEACPTLMSGMVTVLGHSVQLFVGAKQPTKRGSVFFYWHGTGSTAGEAQGIMGPEITEIMKEGGIVASFTDSTKTGMNTANGVWYTGDFAMADEILACAVDQLNIDKRRIYAGGCSAGGLQAGAMLYGRSSYLAAVMPNSGGIVYSYALQDSHVPAVITTHGGSMDYVGVSFAMTSATLDKDVVAKGGFAVDCNHGAGHCQAPADDIAGQWQFCKDHPFGVSPEPYASGLPASLPSYCTIIK